MRSSGAASPTGLIERMETRRLTPPLARPWGPGVERLHLIVVTIRTGSGMSGCGFTWTSSVAAGAIEALLHDDIAGFIEGRSLDETKWDDIARHLREAGSGGVVRLALAGIDLATWDLRGRVANETVAQLIGAPCEACDAYASGINWHYPIDELEQQVARLVEQGAGAVKVKVGPPRSLGEDRDRLQTVRNILGPDRRLMIDANQRWRRDQAVAAIGSLAEFDPAWVEEPIDADDLDGYAWLAQRVPVPIAAGENLSREREFDEGMRCGIAIVQPNLARVGGITPLLRIARLAEARGVRVAPHLLPEVSAQMTAAIGPGTEVEIPDGGTFAELGVLAEPSPITIEGSRVRIAQRAGLGLSFVERLEERHDRNRTR